MTIWEHGEHFLPPAFKKKWTAALRSGQYQQGTGFLKRDLAQGDAEYCCLGVACEIAGVKLNAQHRNTLILSSSKIKQQPAFAKIPKMLIGNITQNCVVEHLTSLNDSRTPFSKIADWIDEHL